MCRGAVTPECLEEVDINCDLAACGSLGGVHCSWSPPPQIPLAPATRFQVREGLDYLWILLTSGQGGASHGIFKAQPPPPAPGLCSKLLPDSMGLAPVTPLSAQLSPDPPLLLVLLS